MRSLTTCPTARSFVEELANYRGVVGWCFTGLGNAAGWWRPRAFPFCHAHQRAHPSHGHGSAEPPLKLPWDDPFLCICRLSDYNMRLCLEWRFHLHHHQPHCSRPQPLSGLNCLIIWLTCFLSIEVTGAAVIRCPSGVIYRESSILKSFIESHPLRCIYSRVIHRDLSMRCVCSRALHRVVRCLSNLQI